MENYLLMGVTNKGKVMAITIVESDNPTVYQMRHIKGKMTSLLGAGKIHEWYYKIEKLSYEAKEDD